MRVTFKNLIGGYTGKADGMVMVFYRRTNRYYLRSAPKRKKGPENTAFQAKMLKMRKIKPDFYYKEDMRVYLELYNSLYLNRFYPVKAWNNLYMKVMFAMEAEIPGVDLTTITRQQIFDQNLPCITVKAAVEAGLLPVVKGYERFDKQI